MILITEFMDDEAVGRLKVAHATNYAPELADAQGDIPAKMAGVQALIVRNRTQVTAALLAASPDLKYVGRLGVGLDNIDVDACKARGVEVMPALGANTLSVAEYVVTNAAILLRDAYQAKHAMMNGDWPRTQSSGREIGGRMLGLLGFGANAQETGRLARAMGMNLIAYDPFLPADHLAWGHAERGEISDVLARADVVSLHVPLTDETRHMINVESIAQMKAGAVLINAARGGVVDEEALVAAMASGQVAGAALDVFETEPLTKEAAEKFKGIKNLVLTPHIAGVTQDSNVRVSAMIADLVLDRLS
ncbi:hydroxyacid dehydrogenase [Shimia haliotis]|uniref:(S)-sulfolactate dehydrogenase n=1 Tax=Shimia haliotis TaxID=1280847 RepID=A0A1I4CXB1_9RHOB|nr:hydroxyacid dehydrogenase [Shimia haliotis]SFK85892.1 (S)-sulfolactate dehydrogenase [Shimia haliotis]